jgi:uncharacterized metal-binding protein YceD (DUF177 family)
VNRRTPEFSRAVLLARLGAEPFRQRIEATAEERELLAQRFDLLALDRLAAEVELRWQGGDVVVLDAAYDAEYEQSCTVTLDPVRGSVTGRFSLIYGPPDSEEPEIAMSGEEPAFEPLTSDAIDIGEAVAQELSLALPEFPRHPDATIDDFLEVEPVNGPFSSLAHFRRQNEC